MSEQDDQIKANQLKLLTEDTQDRKHLNSKLSKLIDLEFQDCIFNILHLSETEFLSNFHNRISLLLQDLYGEDSLGNPTLCNTLRTAKTLFYENTFKLIIEALAEILNRTNLDKAQPSRHFMILRQKSFKYLDSSMYIQHCKSKLETAKHTCGGCLFLATSKVIDVQLVICEGCQFVYYSDSFHLVCNTCNEEYYSCLKERLFKFPQSRYIGKETSSNKASQPCKKANLVAVTWEKYHCKALVNDPMRCLKCCNEFYKDLSSQSGRITCVFCKYEVDPLDLVWKCMVCRLDFVSGVKVFNPLELKPYKLAIKEATCIDRIQAKPHELPCCDYSTKDLEFFHNKKCLGRIYYGKVKGGAIVVCKLCKTLSKYEEFIWTCPICTRRFRYRKESSDELSNLDSRNEDQVQEIGYSDFKGLDVGGSWQSKSNSHRLGDTPGDTNTRCTKTANTHRPVNSYNPTKQNSLLKQDEENTISFNKKPRQLIQQGESAHRKTHSENQVYSHKQNASLNVRSQSPITVKPSPNKRSLFTLSKESQDYNNYASPLVHEPGKLEISKLAGFFTSRDCKEPKDKGPKEDRPDTNPNDIGKKLNLVDFFTKTKDAKIGRFTSRAISIDYNSARAKESTPIPVYCNKNKIKAIKDRRVLMTSIDNDSTKQEGSKPSTSNKTQVEVNGFRENKTKKCFNLKGLSLNQNKNSFDIKIFNFCNGEKPDRIASPKKASQQKDSMDLNQESNVYLQTEEPRLYKPYDKKPRFNTIGDNSAAKDQKTSQNTSAFGKFNSGNIPKTDLITLIKQSKQLKRQDSQQRSTFSHNFNNQEETQNEQTINNDTQSQRSHMTESAKRTETAKPGVSPISVFSKSRFSSGKRSQASIDKSNQPIKLSSLVTLEDFKPAEENLERNSRHNFFNTISSCDGTPYPEIRLEDKKNSKVSLKGKINVKTFRIEDYSYIERIGEGSYSKIYSVRKNSNGAIYSLKKILVSDRIELDCFTQEYTMMQVISHPNILAIHGICIRELEATTAVLYVLMDQAEGDWNREIKLRQKNKAPYSTQELASIMFQLASALSFLQVNGISHRDIKPHNVLVFGNGIYKLADFGEAKLLKGNDKDMSTLRGTEMFMSPLLFYALRNGKTDIMHDPFKSDVYSLGLCGMYAYTLSTDFIYCVRKDLERVEALLNEIFQKKGEKGSKLIAIMTKVLEANEDRRFDFVELKEKMLDCIGDFNIKVF